MEHDDLVGKKHIFEDGMTIEVIQIKMKDIENEVQPFVTYHTYGIRTLPRKLTMTLREFINTYGHLFEQ